jgi:RNA recognition motif-containing protein
VRNLIFDINEKLLKKLFEKFGKIKEISIPRD